MPLGPEDCAVEITSDKMEVTFTLTNAGVAEGLTVADLTGALQAKGVVRGIDQETLNRIVGRPVAGVPHLVARGQASQDGENEQVEYVFTTEGQPLLEESEAGSIDFHKIKNFNNTRQGDVLATKSPATAGKPGFNVLGDDLGARDGKQVAIKVGKGAALSSDGCSAVAEIDGHACLVGDRISVLSMVEIPENVDYSVGDISFIGNVRVRGGVLPGFSVEAQGNIEIGGNVEKAEIRCGGNLDIRGIVFGQGHCHIECQGNATAGAVDQAELEIYGDLTVANYIRHSRVLAGGKVQLTGKKGTIVGGEVASFRGIVSPFVGNSMATLTRLTVGINPFVSAKLEAAHKRQLETETRLGQVAAATATVLERRSRLGGEDPNAEAMLSKLNATREQLEPQLERLNQEVSELQGQAAEFKEAKIRVGEVIFPGVVLNFRDHLQYKTMDEMQRVSFYEEAAEIRNGPY